jgi:DNA-binding CsgD family transcriptional regulator
MARLVLAERMDRAGIVIPDIATISGLGGVALNEGNVGLESHSDDRSALGLSPFHEYLLLVASVGATPEEAAEVFSCNKKDIETARDEIIGRFHARNMAHSVHRAIQGGYMGIEVRKNPSTQRSLSSRDLTVLDGIRKGYSNTEIGSNMGKSKNAVGHYYSRALFIKINASGRTHSVRRSHELGIEVPSIFPET